MLRADAPIFEPPKGYGLTDYEKDTNNAEWDGLMDYEKDTSNAEWASDNSTAVPSPWISPMVMVANSPWITFVSSENLWTGYQDSSFALPDSYVMETWPDFETPLESMDDANFALPDAHDTFSGHDFEAASKADFKLDGLGNLQESLAHLLTGFFPHSDDGPISTTDDASNTNGTNSVNSAPLTPPNLELELPLPLGIERTRQISAPPGLEDIVPIPPRNNQIMSSTLEANVSLPQVMEVASLVSPSMPTQVPSPGVTTDSINLASVTPSIAEINVFKPSVDKKLDVSDTAITTFHETLVTQASTKSDPLPLTTVLLQNIPSKCTRDTFEKWLDEGNFLCHIDFVHVPKNLKNKCNIGHAVVNFRNEKDCTDFSKRFHNIKTKDAFPGTNGKGFCTVSAAQLQGKEANMSKLEKSSLLMSMLASTPEWLPRLFDNEGQPVELTEPLN